MSKDITSVIGIPENFPKLVTYTKLHIQEAQRIQNRINVRESTPMYTILKLQKTQDRENVEKNRKIKPREEQG